ncbi:MAG: HmuY family protein [Bacteroidota bacterium]
MKKAICFSVIIVLAFGCLKEEIPVSPYSPGDVTTSSVNMEPNYKWQMYFDLGTDQMVGKNLKTKWDLGFTCCDSSHNVILNSSRSMFAYPTGTTDYTSVSDTVGYMHNQRFDLPGGNLDSTALNGWENDEVFIIDRGYDSEGTHMGFRKFQVNEANGSQFEVTFGTLESTGNTVSLPRNADYNYTFLNLETGQLVDAEPSKTSWDLVFTQYTHLFYEPEQTPYLVTGCLLNSHETRALQVDDGVSFEEIDLDYAAGLQLTEQQNTIGYDWKTFTGNGFEINSDQIYVIKDIEGYFYKLRFIDFYDDQGNKGTPKFEFQQL